MTAALKSACVFISSTFRDMRAERDHLVRFAFRTCASNCARAAFISWTWPCAGASPSNTTPRKCARK